MSGERALLNSVFGRTAAAVLAATVALAVVAGRGGDPGIRRRGRDQPRLRRQRGCHGPDGDPPTAASIRSAAASGRTTRAARSSSPLAPVPIPWQARSCRSTNRSAAPQTVTSAFPRSTRARARLPAAATPRSARPTNPSSSGRRTPARTSCGVRSTRRGTSSAARRAYWAYRPRTRCSRAISSHRSSPPVNSPGTGPARSSPPCPRSSRGSWPA